MYVWMFHVMQYQRVFTITVEICPWYLLQTLQGCVTCGTWTERYPKLPSPPRFLQMWCQSVSRAHCWPSTMAWAFCVCYNCSCNGGCVTGWIESMVIRTIWRIREASGSSQHRARLSSSYRISRMCLYIVPIIELVNISRCQPFMQQDSQINKNMCRKKHAHAPLL